jgi:hypothetical protein
MKKILSLIAIGGLLFVIYKSYNQAKSSKKEIKLVQ